MVMLALAGLLLGAFILGSVLVEDENDDGDGPDSGLMTPVYNPI
jgi:hypothetical protein